MSRLHVLAGLLCCLLAAPLVMADAHAPDQYEENLVRAIDDLSTQGLDPALQRIEKLVNDNPKFKLAQLIYADLLLAKTRPLDDFGAYPDASRDQLSGLRDEARQRLQHYSTPPDRNAIPASIVKLADNNRHVIVVELERSRLYLFENDNGLPKLVKDYYVSIGKQGADKHVEGDNKTPIGVYNITRFIPDDKLPDFYGSGALPIDYPNRWDHRLGKTGHGIWLHGTPVDTYSRPPLASEGCVALSNDDFSRLRKTVAVRTTPVVITKTIKWLERDNWIEQQRQLVSLLHDWRRDWESLDSGRYLSHYSNHDFKSGNYDYRRWASHKRRVNASKSFIKVGIRNINIFRYPANRDMLEFNFVQDYRSSNYSKAGSNKKLFWQRGGNGRWQIIYDGPA